MKNFEKDENSFHNYNMFTLAFFLYKLLSFSINYKLQSYRQLAFVKERITDAFISKNSEMSRHINHYITKSPLNNKKLIYQCCNFDSSCRCNFK